MTKVAPEEKWQPLGQRVWVGNYRVPGFKCRSIAFKLADNTWCVYGPGRSLVDSFETDVLEGGRVEWLVAPNSFHYMGISRWREQFPQAAIAAGSNAHKRLHKKGVSGVRTLNDLHRSLPEGVSIIEIPESRLGETWIDVIDGADRLLFVGDAFFNFPPAKRLQPRIVQKVLKSGPGVAVSQLYLLGGVKNRAKQKAWLQEKLSVISPNVWVPQHGNIDRGPDVTRRLLEVVEARY